MGKLLDRTLEEGQERIHFEASRLLVIIATSNQENLKLVMEKGNTAKGIRLLLSTDFALLHAEAIKILLDICKEGKEDYSQQLIDAGVLEELQRILPLSEETSQAT